MVVYSHDLKIKEEMVLPTPVVKDVLGCVASLWYSPAVPLLRACLLKAFLLVHCL